MSGVECSVIVPTRDRPGQLGDCLDALGAQSMAPDAFEVIVVDDGSRDEMAPRLSRWTGRLTIRHVRTPGIGPAAARNAGIALASGAWLAFTDDDCLPAPGWLDAMRRARRRHPSALVGGPTANRLPDCAAAEASQLITDIVLDYYNADAGQPRFFPSNNMAVDAARLRDVGGFNKSFRTAEDRDLCDRWRLARLPLAFAPDAVVGHAHRMTLASFIRQHAGYGRGAHRFMRAHRQRQRTTSTFEPMFYTGLLPRALRLLRGRRRPAALAALLVVWQLANAAGYLQAWAGGMAAPARGSR